MRLRPIPADIKNFIQYNGNTGELVWIKSPRNKNVAGTKVTGAFDKDGYTVFGFMRAQYRLHRVAYFLFYGKQPNIVDHIDGDITNNRSNNLRSTDISGNGRNKKMHRSGTVAGVRFNKKAKKWVAYTKRPQVHLGSFNSQAEAIVAVATYENGGRK